VLFPILTVEWLQLVLYSTCLQNIIIPDGTLCTYILFWKNLAVIRSEASQNLFWEYINGKVFAVHKGRTSICVLLLHSLQHLTKSLFPFGLPTI
jgi:hypothetical protein